MSKYLGPSMLKKLAAETDEATKPIIIAAIGVYIRSSNDPVCDTEEYTGYRDTEMAYQLGPGFSSGPQYRQIEKIAAEGDYATVPGSRKVVRWNGSAWTEV
jgi:hypothetical protein